MFNFIKVSNKYKIIIIDKKVDLMSLIMIPLLDLRNELTLNIEKDNSKLYFVPTTFPINC